MLDLLLDQARSTRTTRLDADAYGADFTERFWRIDGEGFWKLESRQSYRETGFPSWEAFRAGDWDGALDLVAELRPEFEQYYGKISASGFGLHRVRVTDEPVTPYVQWEMHILRLREQCGEDVAVLPSDHATALASRTGADPLPDLVVLGAEAVYEVHCTEDGAPDGATLFTDPEVVGSIRAFIQRLHASGEQLATWFPRQIAGLGAPRV
jgi:hypothetical protein